MGSKGRQVDLVGKEECANRSGFKYRLVPRSPTTVSDRLSDETKYNLLAGAGISEISTQCIYRSESSLGDDVSLFQNEDVDQLAMTALMWNMGRPIRDRRN
jgi:hypothetical protein